MIDDRLDRRFDDPARRQAHGDAVADAELSVVRLLRGSRLRPRSYLSGAAILVRIPMILYVSLCFFFPSIETGTGE